MPAIKLNLKPNLFLLFLYLSEIILKILIFPITCSTKILSDDNFLLFCLSFPERGFFLLFFFGNKLFLCNFKIPTYPVSAFITIFSVIFNLLSLKILKSCLFPFAKFSDNISDVSAFTSNCVFIVCRLFLPE